MSRALPPAARRHSIPSGDVVLCNLPPYSTQPWLSMGVVLHAALLAGAGIRARVVRPIDPPFHVPDAALHASLVTFSLDPPMPARIAAMEAAYRETPAFFDDIVTELLRGGEPLIGLSLFRNNVDFSLYIAKLIKERSPSTFILLGGPEAIEEPASLLLPWIDAAIGNDAESIIVPLIQAILARRPERARTMRNVWLQSDRNRDIDQSLRPPLPTPPLPIIDYRDILPLLVGDAEPTVPLLLNWGCPYHCSFCSNRGIYSRFVPGRTDRVIEEIDRIMSVWRALHDGASPPICLQLSDATTNALPAQFDEFLQQVVEHTPRWGQRPFLRGQTLFDTRVTAERVRLWSEANFGNTFFGLDGASDEQRRAHQKPGTALHVLDAMALYHQSGSRGLTFGIPVGLPGETDDHFRDIGCFLDRALEFASSFISITVLPYVFFRSAQDPSLVAINHGERRGVLWRADVPGGDPAVRARRFMRLFDSIDNRTGGRVPLACPIPPYIALPAMLPDEDPAVIDAWMARHGRTFDQLTPSRAGSSVAAAEAPSIDTNPDQPPSPAWSRVERAFDIGVRCGPWVIESRERRGAEPGLIVVFRRDAADPVAVSVEPRAPERPAFGHTRDYNVRYLRSWRGADCGFDESLLRACVNRLLRVESGPTP